MKSLIIILAFVLSAWSSESVAFIKNTHNDARVKRDNAVHTAKIGEYLFSGDTIHTGKNSSIGLSFNDGTRIAIGPESEFIINDYLFQPTKKDFKFNVTLPKGTMVFESGKIGKLAPEKVNIKVPQGIIGIRGTKFIVDAE
ncbi:FecR family protein [Sulfuricurvum sp.]|uniref:FecR family protein n=1 Tax=Sulfuricurvum sp. TaxID=2025608 RepID=UPI002D5EC10E|nr:FecR family protein [Sulfuricurvum sp.]HZF69904.1 FecR family protein [Sulfuricurvum sp.]